VCIEILFELKTNLGRLLLTTAFISLSVGFTFAVRMESQAASAMSPGAAEQGQPGAIPQQEEHGLSQSAVKIDRWGSFITNSMVVSWVVAIGLIIFARVATRDMKHVPGGAQNFLEWLVEGPYSFLENIIGSHLIKRTFWFFATIFIFILSANWLGLIPGVGTIGWGHETSHGFKIEQPLLRGANADVNLTLAMALLFFACWIVWSLREVGPIGFQRAVRAQRRHGRGDESAHGGGVFRSRLFGNCLDFVSPRLSDFSTLRQYLCR
jgi:F-type H+-transporting ATPase subunit a